MQSSKASVSTAAPGASKLLHTSLPPASIGADPKAYAEGFLVRAIRDIDVGGKIVVWKDTHGVVLAPTQDSESKGRLRIGFEARADGGNTSQAIMVHPTEITEIELSEEHQTSEYLPVPKMEHPGKLWQLDLEEIEMEPQMLTVGSEIGQGRFKTVLTALHKARGPVAVLCYAADSDCHEARILGMLAKGEHGDFHFPELYGAMEDPSGDLLLAQEVSMLGPIKSVLQEPDLAPMVTPVHKLHFAAQIAGAVDFLETVHIIHTDIACRNVMIFQLEDEPELTTVKLTDFGCALILPPGAGHIVNQQPQATRWCAPETVASMMWSHKTDIWSLGATLWELFSETGTPWPRWSKRSAVAKRLRELAQNGGHVDDEFPAPRPGLYPLVAHTSALSCLQVDAALRPPACCVALAFEKLLDLSVVFGDQFDLIDEGLETLTVSQSALQASLTSPAAPVQERSRARNKQSSPRSESLTARSADSAQTFPASPTAPTVFSSRLVQSNEPAQRDDQPFHQPVHRQISARVQSEESRPQDDEACHTTVQRQVSYRKASSASSQMNQSVDVSTLAGGSSVTATPNRFGASSTPSTADTPSPAASQGRGAHERRPAVHREPAMTQNHFEQIDKFLASQEAAKAVDQAQLKAMITEIASAQVREAYWSGVSERSELQAIPAPHSSNVVVPLEPRGGYSWGVSDQAEAPVQSGKWSLWTYVSPALRRDDFSSEGEAKAAMGSRNDARGEAPCVLRDPYGKMLGGTCWRTNCA